MELLKAQISAQSDSPSSVMESFSEQDERRLRLLDNEAKQLRAAALNADKLQEQIILLGAQVSQQRAQLQQAAQIEDENARLRAELDGYSEYHRLFQQLGFELDFPALSLDHHRLACQQHRLCARSPPSRGSTLVRVLIFVSHCDSLAVLMEEKGHVQSELTVCLSHVSSLFQAFQGCQL